MSSSSPPSACAEALSVKSTPVHELERMLASLPPQTKSVGAATRSTPVDAATPRVDLLLRPAPTPTSDASNSVLLPARTDTTAATSSPAAPVGAQLSRVCATCQRQYAKYVCPKCNLNTCSLACYKSHNESCTHTFAAASLEEERVVDTALRKGIGRTRAVLGEEYAAAKQARRATQQIMERVADFQQEDLQRMQQVMQQSGNPMAQQEGADGEEAADEDETEQRLLAALSLLEQLEHKTGADVAAGPISNSDLLSLQSLLPAALLKDFQRSIVDGRMSAWIARWKPWWRPHIMHGDDESDEAKAKQAEQQQEIAPDNWSIPAVQMLDPADDLPADAPPLPTIIPAFSSLFPGSPSPLLPLHLAELLYAYVFVLSLYNGDLSDAAESVALMAALASPLSTQPTHLTGDELPSTDSSAAASSSPSSSPFLPTPSLLPSLHASVTGLLTRSSSLPSVSASCCWAVARMGDVCQLQCSKASVLRALAHMHTIVQRAKQEAKRSTKKHTAAAAIHVAAASSSPAAPAASSSSIGTGVVSLPLSAMLRKLEFFQSFVQHALPDTALRAWNRTLYDVWTERWQMHAEMHATAKGRTDTDTSHKTNSQAAAAAPVVEIVQDPPTEA